MSRLLTATFHIPSNCDSLSDLSPWCRDLLNVILANSFLRFVQFQISCSSIIQISWVHICGEKFWFSASRNKLSLCHLMWLWACVWLLWSNFLIKAWCMYLVNHLVWGRCLSYVHFRKILLNFWHGAVTKCWPHIHQLLTMLHLETRTVLEIRVFNLSSVFETILLDRPIHYSARVSIFRTLLFHSIFFLKFIWIFHEIVTLWSWTLRIGWIQRFH